MLTRTIRNTLVIDPANVDMDTGMPIVPMSSPIHDVSGHDNIQIADFAPNESSIGFSIESSLDGQNWVQHNARETPQTNTSNIQTPWYYNTLTGQLLVYDIRFPFLGKYFRLRIAGIDMENAPNPLDWVLTYELSLFNSDK